MADPVEEEARETAATGDAAPSGGAAANALFGMLQEHVFLWEREIPLPGKDLADRLSILPPPDLFHSAPVSDTTDLAFEILGGETHVFLGRARSFDASGRRIIIAEIAFICPDLVRDGAVNLHLVHPDGSAVTLVLETTRTLEKERIVWWNRKETTFGGFLVDSSPGQSLKSLLEANIGPVRDRLDVARYSEVRDDEQATIRIGPACFALLRRGTLQGPAFPWSPTNTPGGTLVEIRISLPDVVSLREDPDTIDGLTRFLLNTTLVRHHYRRALAADPRLRKLASLSPEAQQAREPKTEKGLLLLMKDVVACLARQDAVAAAGEPAQAVFDCLEKAREGDNAAFDTVKSAVSEAIAPGGAPGKRELVSFAINIATLDTIGLRLTDTGKDTPSTDDAPMIHLWPGTFGRLEEQSSELSRDAAASARKSFPDSPSATGPAGSGSGWPDMPYRLRIFARTGGPLDTGEGAGGDCPLYSRIISDIDFSLDQSALSVEEFFCNPISWLLQARRRLGSLSVAGSGAQAFENLLGKKDLMESVIGRFSDGAPPFILDLVDTDLQGWIEPISRELSCLLAQGIHDDDVAKYFSPLKADSAGDLFKALKFGLDWAGFERLGAGTAEGFLGLLANMKRFRLDLEQDAERLPEACPHDLGPKPAGLLDLSAVTTTTATGKRIIDEWTWTDRLGAKADQDPDGARDENRLFLRLLYPDKDPFGRRVVIQKLGRLAESLQGEFPGEGRHLDTIGNDLATLWGTVSGDEPLLRGFVGYIMDWEQELAPEDRVAKLITML